MRNGTIVVLGLVLMLTWAAPLAARQAPAPPAGSASVRVPGDLAPDRLSSSDWSSIRAAFAAGRHAAAVIVGGHRADNPGQQWSTRFDGRGFTTDPDAGGWSWGLELERWGFAGQERSVAEPPRVRAEGPRVSYDWAGDLTEWYVNDTRGLEHGYTVHRRPQGADGSGPLAFTLSVRGGLRPEVLPGGRGLRFLDRQGAAALTYTGLTGFDADGRELCAGFEASPGRVRILIDESGARYPLTIDPLAQQAYLKASNTNVLDNFGFAVSVSGDTAVVGAPSESSQATGVNGDQGNNEGIQAGAAYVFVRNGSTWSQEAYLKASNTGNNHVFGYSVAVSGDTIVVGGPGEMSLGTGVNGNQDNFGAQGSGAAYVFVRNGSTWSQEAYFKASNADAEDQFGISVAVSGDTVVVGAPQESSGATGVDGDQSDDDKQWAGAAYVFVRNGTTWSQEAYLKASNTDFFDRFGSAVALSNDTLVVGSPEEDSAATGVNGDQNNEGIPFSGAAYVFVRSGTNWSQAAYLKASNPDVNDFFGTSLSISGDTVVIGAGGEDSNATGVNGDQTNDDIQRAGAAYVFVRNGTAWSQEAYLKASNTDSPGDGFGEAVSVSGDTIVVGAFNESSNATGVNGDEDNDAATSSGAAYVFSRSGTTWSQAAYLKASNTGPGDHFGSAVALAGGTVVVGARAERSDATGVNGDGNNDNAPHSGAAYVLETAPTQVSAYCTGKLNSAGCVPTMGWSGSPSASSPSPFLLTCADVLNFKAGLLFYGFGAAAIPFQGATLCVQPPLRRTSLQFSGGNPPPPSDCSGSYSFDMNAHIQGGADAALVPGTAAFSQYWGRDPAASFGTSLSDAVSLEIAP